MSESLPTVSMDVDTDPKTIAKDPAAILASTNKIEARTLTISDQHATILLPQADSDQKALLKLTLVPFHKTELASLTPANLEEEKQLSEQEQAAKKEQREKDEKEHSSKVLGFLSRYDWSLSSESGAEYSYYEGFPKTSIAQGDLSGEPVLKKPKPSMDERKGNASVFKAELIFPASERQLSRAMPSPGLSLIHETPELYRSVTKPFIDETVASGSLEWLKNVVQVKKEKERLLWNAEGWILNIDTKWRTHPDALTVPRSEFYKHESIVDLYCLGIIKQDGVTSLRDLTGDHLPVLREMLEQGPKVIEGVYGVPKDQLRIFVHYQPQFYHFHVHFTRLENDIGAQVEKAHLLSDVIQDLEDDPECFQKKTLVYKLSLKDKLYKLLKAYEQKKDDKE
jgi:m7GpppX diphosphatase